MLGAGAMPLQIVPPGKTTPNPYVETTTPETKRSRRKNRRKKNRKKSNEEPKEPSSESKIPEAL